MAFSFQKHYAPEIEQLLRQYYQSLSEKDRRRFAAVEALTLGHGGITYIANVLGCDPQTIHEGIRELKQLPDDPGQARPQTRGRTQEDGSQASGIAPACATHDQRSDRWRPHA